MVSLGTVIGLSAIGLIIFFQKDIGIALGNLKGFGSSFGQDFGKLPDININVPDFGLPEAGAVVSGALGEAGENINQFGIDVQKNIGDSIKGAQDVIDQSIKETQENFEQFGIDVNTNIGIIGEGITDFGTGITDFFGGLFKAPSTTISASTPSIVTTSRRSGTTTRFGGQTAPKEVLTKTTASTPTVIKSEQPDLSLVSPFLTAFQKDPITEPTLITSRRTGTTGGRWVGW